MSADRGTCRGACAPWTPAEDKSLEPFIWMQRETPGAVISREPSRLDVPRGALRAAGHGRYIGHAQQNRRHA